LESTGSNGLIEYLSKLDDPRVERTKRHKLIDVMVIAICAVLYGADTWVDVELFGKSKKAWLAASLNCPTAFPLPTASAECVQCWMRSSISSLPAEAKRSFQGRTTRGYWGIENSVHWVLDVAFREDESRGNGAENFSTLRRMALNMLKQETTSKGGTAAKRKRAGWDEEYLLTVLPELRCDCPGGLPL